MTTGNTRNRAMYHWLIAASAAEAQKLAAAVGTSVPYLRQIAYGERRASADMAGAIERASQELSKETKHRLPVLQREELCAACAVCPHITRV